MEYIKIEVSFKYAPKRLNRTIAIREDVDLLMLGAIIGASLKADFEHAYLFKDQTNDYYASDWIEDMDKDIPMNDVMLGEMDDHFTFIYDPSENYEFDIHKLNTTYKYYGEYDFDPLAMVVDGNGMGIFEGDIHSLCAYLDGEIDPELDYDDDDLGYYLPLNLDIDKFLEFDFPIDIDELVFDDDEIYDIAKKQDNNYGTWNYEDEDDEERNYLLDIFAGAMIHKIEDDEARNQKLYDKFNELSAMNLEDRPYEIMTAIAINSAIEMLIEDSDEYIDRIIYNLNKLFRN